MSIESAKAFIERMQTDNNFAKKIMSCKDFDSARQIILAEGFNFTHDEYKSLYLDMDDEVLESIAGGTGCCSANDCIICKVL
jgi:predicted ribosomally synthesized peptide with nif11-like leader